MFNVARGVASKLLGRDKLDSESDFVAKLLKFSILLEQWPYRMSWLLKFLENTQQA